MGIQAHVRVKNIIKYGNPFGENGCTEKLLKQIRSLEEDYEEEIISWDNEYNDNIELDYGCFVDAMKKVYKEEKHGTDLMKIYREVMNSEDSKKNGFIRIDWL